MIFQGRGIITEFAWLCLNDREYEMDKGSPSQQLLTDPYRLPVEQIVSKHYRCEWRVKVFRSMDEFASHPAAILSDGNFPVFVKLSEAANGLDQFQIELAGLHLLTEQAGVLTPELIGIIPKPFKTKSSTTTSVPI